MSAEHKQIRWDCLPHNPEAFFALGAQYDRKDLKRRYNAMIRRFKPERFPEEFQRIRAAYEVLDGQLRYGQSVQIPPTTSRYEWSTAESGPASPLESSPRARCSQPKAPAAPRRSVPLQVRMQAQSPGVLYRELSRRREKTAYEYYALALLSDVVGDDALLFVRWLLTGLHAHPEEPGLFALLYEYLHSELPQDAAAGVLLATAKIVRNDRFYFLTEKLWDTLLRSTTFEVFAETLRRCEQCLVDHRIDGRLAFYIHVLRGGVWKAEQRWLDKAFTMLEEHHEEVPPHLEYDLEVLFWLREYREHAAELVGTDPVREQIHQAIVDYCTLQQREASQRFIHCQASLATDAEALLAGFPLASKDFNGMLILWRWIGDEVAGQLDIEEDAQEAKGVAKRVYRLMRNLDEIEGNLFWQCYGLVHLAVIAIPYLLFTFGPAILFAEWISGAVSFFILFSIGLATALTYHLWLRCRWVEPWFLRMTWRVMAGKYRRQWRGRVVQLMGATRTTPEQLQSAVSWVTESQHEELGVSTWLHQFIAQDYGLAFYALAVRFLH